VESIKFLDDSNATVLANIGALTCNMDFIHSAFDARLNDGTITGWKLAKINCVW